MDADALTALSLLVDWGADEALDDEPTDRLAPKAVPTPLPRPAAPVTVAGPPAAERARAAAAAADTLPALRAAIAAFDGIGLRDTATGPVLFHGDPAGGLLLIAPPPSADDDRAGRALAGASGAFLDAMLASIGLARERLLLAPLIPWRPPGDRPPSPAELATCLPFLHRLIALARPRLAVPLGALATRALLGAERRPPRGRISDVTVPGCEAPLSCLALAAPSQLRADPEARPAAWSELRQLRRWIDAGFARK